MPIHDWTRVNAGVFHHFHQRWIGAITDVLNQRPEETYRLAFESVPKRWRSIIEAS
jgi:hypothetical protein